VISSYHPLLNIERYPLFSKKLRQILEEPCLTGGGEAFQLGVDLESSIGGKSIALNSYFSSIVTCLISLGFRSGDMAIVPGLLRKELYDALTLLGADIVPVDINEDTLGIDLAQAGRHAQHAGDHKEKVYLINSHPWGMPATIGLPEIFSSAYRSLAVVEDAHDSWGSRFAAGWRDRKSSAIVFDFGWRSPVGALGSAGVVSFASELAYLEAMGVCGSPMIQDEQQGLHCELDELQAAVISEKIGNAELFRAHLSSLASAYAEHLAGVPGIVLVNSGKMDDWSFHRFPVYSTRAPSLIPYLRGHDVLCDGMTHIAIGDRYELQKSHDAVERIVLLPMSYSMDVSDVKDICHFVSTFHGGEDA